MKKNNTEQGTDLNFFDGHNFYIFGEIDSSIPKSIIVPMISFIEKQSKKNEQEMKEMNIYITSYGGDAHYAFDIITHIEFAKSIGIVVNTFVTSVACSAGSLIAVTGSNRFVSKRAYHLLHFMRGWAYSTSPEMTKRNTTNDLFLQDELVKIYQKYTKLKKIEDKLLADNFMINGSDDLIKYGLADKVI